MPLLSFLLGLFQRTRSSGAGETVIYYFRARGTLRFRRRRIALKFYFRRWSQRAANENWCFFRNSVQFYALDVVDFMPVIEINNVFISYYSLLLWSNFGILPSTTIVLLHNRIFTNPKLQISRSRYKVVYIKQTYMLLWKWWVQNTRRRSSKLAVFLAYTHKKESFRQEHKSRDGIYETSLRRFLRNIDDGKLHCYQYVRLYNNPGKKERWKIRIISCGTACMNEIREKTPDECVYMVCGSELTSGRNDKRNRKTRARWAGCPNKTGRTIMQPPPHSLAGHVETFSLFPELFISLCWAWCKTSRIFAYFVELWAELHFIFGFYTRMLFLTFKKLIIINEQREYSVSADNSVWFAGTLKKATHCQILHCGIWYIKKIIVLTFSGRIKKFYNKFYAKY